MHRPACLTSIVVLLVICRIAALLFGVVIGMPVCMGLFLVYEYRSKNLHSPKNEIRLGLLYQVL
jgi:hypothetical protein